MHDHWLQMKETLNDYMWTMRGLIYQKPPNDSQLFDKLTTNLMAIDHYLHTIYVRFVPKPDGTVTFQIKKKLV